MALAWVEHDIILERKPAHMRREPNPTYVPETEPPDAKNLHWSPHGNIIFFTTDT
jgi:hypothetical protein